MKTKYLLLFILLICSLTSKAENKIVTFEVGKDSNTDTKAKFITKDGITITVTNGHFYRSDYYLFSSGCDVTFSSCVGKITNVHLNFGEDQGTLTHKVNNKNQFTNSKTKKAATWTGSLTSFTAFNSGESQVTSIAVTYDRSITMSSSTYATFWCERAYTMPTGLMGYTISDVTNGKVVYGMTYEAGSMVPANTPLLIRGDKGTYAITTSDDNTAAPTPNLLQCAMGTKVSSEGTYYYKVSYRSSTDKTIGFFWDVEGGRSVNIDYGKAFMAVPAPVAAGAKGFVFDNIANGIDMMPMDDAMDGQPKAGEWIYDTNGRAYRYSSSIDKGIYITKGGRKIVIH